MPNSIVKSRPDAATYACKPENSRGRQYKEEESTTRSLFQRDRDRIIHSAAFRRLEYKTQVFVNHEGDYYRTRLTHSLEVAQVARSISRELSLDDDLSEALALAHDLGHTPFGHAGEDALNEAMGSYGGFDHNAQTLRILTKLETRYANFDGLNLTWDTLEGVAKHNGPLISKAGDFTNLPRAMAEFNDMMDLELHTWPSAEAQVAALSDDIAYNNHDIDDGLRAGLFTVEQIMELPLIGSVFQTIMDRHKGIEGQRLIHESVRRLINIMIVDVVQETRKRVADNHIKSVDDIRMAGKSIVSFSDEMNEYNRQLKNFLMEHMYRHYRLNRMTSKAKRILSSLFDIFLKEPECLPNEWYKLTNGASTIQTAQLVCDYIAGMTDRFAIDEYTRLFDMGVRS